MDQKIMDSVFQILLDHADELEEQGDPFGVVRNDTRFKNAPKGTLHKIFVELFRQDKVSILWQGGDIVSVFANTDLTKKHGKASPRMPGPNAVIFVDVANIQHGKGLPPHVFPGNEINKQLSSAGYLVRGRFALINTKGVDEGVITPFDLYNQAVMLRQQGHFPVLCPYISAKRPSPDDDMLMELARTYYGHPDVETILVVSGDADYGEVKGEAEKMGHDFGVFTVSSNISEEWLQQSRATMLDLSEGEQRAYKFLEQYLQAFKQGKELETVAGTEEDSATIFLHQIIQQVATIRGHSQFVRFCGMIWDKLPEVLRNIYTKDLLFRAVRLILSYTTIIKSEPYTDRNGRPGRGFAVRRESADLKLFLGSPSP